MIGNKALERAKSEVAHLRARLSKAEERLHAIRMEAAGLAVGCIVQAPDGTEAKVCGVGFIGDVPFRLTVNRRRKDGGWGDARSTLYSWTAA